MQFLIVFSAGHISAISNLTLYPMIFQKFYNVFPLSLRYLISFELISKHLCCQFQLAGTHWSILAHSCIPWTLGGDFPPAVTWCWWSNGWDDPVEMGVMPPWMIPICCVQGVEHYLVVPLNKNGIKQTLWPRIGINREIKNPPAKDNTFEKVEATNMIRHDPLNL